MRKLFTTALLSLLSVSFGFTAQAQQIIEAGWDEPITPEADAEVQYLIPEYYGYIKVTTDSDSDITWLKDDWNDESNLNNIIFSDSWGAGSYYQGVPYSYFEWDDFGHYVYYYDLTETDYNYSNDHLRYVLQYNKGGVTFTISQADATGPVVNKIEPGIPFIAGPDAKEWVLDNSSNTYGDINDFYIQSNKKINYLNSFSFVRDDGFVTLEFTAEEDEDGNYVYVKTASSPRIVDYNYIFTFNGYEDVEFTFVKGEYVKSAEFRLGEKFTANTTDKIFKNFGVSIEGPVYIETNSTTDLLQLKDIPFTLETASTKTNLIAKDRWKAVKNKETGCYGYNGYLSITNDDLIFTYTGTSSLTITIAEGMYTENGPAVYMEEAQITPSELLLNTLDGIVELSWGENITINNEEESLNYKIGDDIEGYSINCAEFMQISNNGVASAFQNGATGDKILFNFGAAFNGNLIIDEYHFFLPAGIVVNSSGALNPDQNFDISVIEPPVVEEESISPVSGSEFKPGENVTISINYNHAPTTEEASVTNVAIVKDNDRFEQIVTWDSGASISDNSVVINLGNELPAGTYTLTLNEGAVKINRASNKAIEGYTFSVIGSLPEPVVTPAEGEVDTLDSITLSWADYTISSVDNSSFGITFDETPVENFSVSSNGSTVTIKFNEPQTQAGEYVVTADALAVTATNSNSIKYMSQALELTYNISSISFEATPAENTVLSTLAGQEITLDISLVGQKYADIAKVTVEVSNNADASVVVLPATEMTAGNDNSYSYIPASDGDYILYNGQTYDVNFTVYNTAGDQTASYSTAILGSAFGILPDADTVVPQEGALESLKSVVLTWNDYTISDVDADKVTVTYDNNPLEVSLVTFRDSSVTIELADEETEGGSYVVTIAADAVTANKTDYDVFRNNDITLVYNMSTLGFEVTPANDSELETLSNQTISLTIDPKGPGYQDIAAINVVVANAADNQDIIFEGQLNEGPANEWNVTVPQNDALYLLYKDQNYVATFTVTNSDDESIAVYSVKWIGTGEAPVLPKPVVSPEEGEVESLSTVSLTWEGWTVMSINPDLFVTVSINDEETDIEVTANIEEKVNEAGETVSSLVLTLDLSAVEETEDYEVSISVPELLVTLANGDFEVNNEAVELVYMIQVNSEDEPGDGDNTDGITAIQADADGYYRVYTLNGVNIITSKNANDISNLSKGIYIINGKKMKF